MPVEIDEDFIRARVVYDLAMKSAEGNYTSMSTLSFKNVELLRDKSWLPRLAEALSKNTTCTELDLSSTGLTDEAVQQLAASLAVPSRCPKLRRLNLSGNPSMSKMGETVVCGLCRLRVGLELTLDDRLDPKAEGFVHDKELVPGRTSWPCDDINVPDGGMHAFYCPEEVVKAATPAAVTAARAEAETKDGERLRLTRGFQGPNGTKYRCGFATFEHIHATGNMVLMTLESAEGDEGIVV